MTGLFGRLANAFVAPPAVEPDVAGERRRAAGRRGRDPRERAAPSPASVAVLCRPEDALVVGGGIALLLAARCRASHALVAVWGGEGPPPLRAPAAAAARRLATTLSERG
ncbi:MAG TPA: hypothetical protein VHF89_17565, partial [Solirubrobacteraceae bacterium]|nr:hypothetical protein [Solirubrobacteraceae bacterium]